MRNAPIMKDCAVTTQLSEMREVKHDWAWKSISTVATTLGDLVAESLRPQQIAGRIAKKKGARSKRTRCQSRPHWRAQGAVCPEKINGRGAPQRDPRGKSGLLADQTDKDHRDRRIWLSMRRGSMRHLGAGSFRPQPKGPATRRTGIRAAGHLQL